MFYSDNSAKQYEVDEITPLSNYVHINNDGKCTWPPRYELSIIQCTIDQTWFPFDDQRCQLVFKSWHLRNLRKHELNLSPILQAASKARAKYESNEWEYISTYW